METKKGGIVFLAFAVFLFFSQASSVPSGLYDESAVDALLAEVEIPAIPFHFRVPLDIPIDADAFENLEFISLAETESENKEEEEENEPIRCETICRPMTREEEVFDVNETKAAVAGMLGGLDKMAEGAAATAAVPGAVAALQEGTPAPTVLLEVKREICHAKGGNWNQAASNCEDFMRATEAKSTFDSKKLFSLCQQEFGELYAPCGPYQALALAHLYKVPDHERYWLWPGGRFNQATSGALKNDKGYNPVSGLDTCGDDQHVGFYHNWDQQHTDSWGCYHKAQESRVLCCRRA